MPRILVVDDEASLRDLLSRFLTEQGYEVDLAASGPEAVSRLEKWAPDALVLDLLLPGMTGLGVLRQMKEKNLKAGYVLVMSGQTHASSLGLDALDSGADYFIPKPFDLRMLESIIEAGMSDAAQATPTFTEQRAHPRVEVSLPVQIDLGTYGTTLIGETVDLSRGGIQARVDREVAVGTTCVVRIPQAAEMGVQDGTVARVEPDGELFRIAIQFSQPSKMLIG